MSTRSVNDLIRDAASTAIYLHIGFEIARRMNPEERYDATVDQHGGHLNVVRRIAACALWANSVLPSLSQDFPGVFHYQVTEYLGIWLFSNLNASQDEFVAKLKEMARDERALAVMPPDDQLDTLRFTYNFMSYLKPLTSSK